MRNPFADARLGQGMGAAPYMVRRGAQFLTKPTRAPDDGLRRLLCLPLIALIPRATADRQFSWAPSPAPCRHKAPTVASGHGTYIKRVDELTYAPHQLINSSLAAQPLPLQDNAIAFRVALAQIG